MKTYIVYGRSNSEYASGMVSKPQNRIDVVKPMLDQFNIKIREFLFTSSESFNFFSVVEAENDSDVEALSAIVLSSGTWDSMHWSRAYESLEYKKIYEKAHDGVNSYVTSMQLAGEG
jgi:uncharacterized protein with GYD domain|tara:strand:- start:183 stop:533 length:351 start_codon:yes stop_codon:yes gene_type:complete